MFWDLMPDPVWEAAKWQPQRQICHQLYQPEYLPDIDNMQSTAPEYDQAQNIVPA